MINVTETDFDGLYEVTVSGRVREDDYEDVLIPALDAAIEKHDRIRLLLVLAEDASFSIGAMLDDAEFGLRHWRGFDRMAVVAKKGWMTRGIRAMSFLMPCPVELFEPGQMDEARRWLQESLGAIHQTDLGDGVLHVALLGRLDSKVYAEETQDMNAFVRKTDRFRLLLDLREFDGWQGLGALGQHFRLARDHYGLLDKAAVVGDAAWQKLAQRVMGEITGIETRHFTPDRFEAAKVWIKS